MIKNIIILLLPVLGWSQMALQQTQQYIESKSFIKAQQTIHGFLKEHPNHLEAVELYGDTFGYLTKWDEAITIYKN
jgi:hypothetical protein